MNIFFVINLFTPYILGHTTFVRGCYSPFTNLYECCMVSHKHILKVRVVILFYCISKQVLVCLVGCMGSYTHLVVWPAVVHVYINAALGNPVEAIQVPTGT